MCGIVGVIAKSKHGFSIKHIDLFSDLLRADELRGEDSTGIIYVENDAAFGIMKEASPASWCSKSMVHSQMLTNKIQKGKALIGHNRKATVGRVTDETAHPFVVDNTFAMVHNGTLYGHKELKDTEVDSEALAHHLSKVFTTSATKDELETEVGKVDGAYAVAAYNQDNNTVFLMRNSQRPLFFMELPDAWCWASEAGMLYWIVGRHGYDLQKLKGEMVKEHSIVAIDLDTNMVEHQEFSPKKVTPPVTIPTTVSGGTTANTKEGKVLSKQEFKRLKRQFLGTRHSFYADDWAEKNFPKTLEDGETEILLMGEFDGEAFAKLSHVVTAVVDVKELFGDDVPDDPTETTYHGVISEMILSRSTNEVTFIMDKVKPFSKSVVSTQTIADKLIGVTQGKWNAANSPFVH